MEFLSNLQYPTNTSKTFLKSFEMIAQKKNIQAADQQEKNKENPRWKGIISWFCNKG